jgi:hypothetical protein
MSNRKAPLQIQTGPSDISVLRDTLAGILHRAIGSLHIYRYDNPPVIDEVLEIVTELLGELALAIPPQFTILDAAQALKIEGDNSTINTETGDLAFFDVPQHHYEHEIKHKITGPFEEHVRWPGDFEADITNTFSIEREYFGPIQGNKPVVGVTLIFKRHGAERGE